MSEETAFEIHIDRGLFKVTAPKLSGIQLRALSVPPIGPDRDLFEKVVGTGDDRVIGDAEQVTMQNGLHFYSVPRTITAGY